MTIEERASLWLSKPFDVNTQKEVKKLKEDPKKLEDAFYTSLKFGTGGMRGIMGAGTNRINKYTLGKSTQGLSNFLLKKYPNEQIKTVVAYDSRNNSKYFAEIVASIFTSNGILCYLFSEIRPTPELSFAVRFLKTHCGIVLTASHNPANYNGYKVYGEDGGQLVPPDDKFIMNEIDNTSFNQIKFEGNKNLLHYVDEKIDYEYYNTVLDEVLMHNLDRSNLKIVFTPLHGTSITAIPKVLDLAGYKKKFIVKEQEKPDGNFPTVKSPNPEDKLALKMAVSLASKKNADLVIGTDPDADRLGIVVRDLDNDWYYLNGNQIMVIFTEYLLNKLKKNNQLGSNNFIASTIVSSPMILKLANSYGVKYKNCLTGFKWIAKLIKDSPDLKFIGGGEESYGYLIGDKIRDKDAISASLLACELASELKYENKSIYKYLIDCYIKYGLYVERLISITKEGKDGADQIISIMKEFRETPPKELGTIPILEIDDYLLSESKNLKKNQTKKIDLPKENVLIFRLEDGSKISLRPSGTEPKIKFYFSVNSVYKKKLPLKIQQKRLNNKIDLFINDIII